jgi:hypothetical protein
MQRTSPRLPRFLTRPVLDVLHGLERCLERGLASLVVVLLGLLAGWWVYVVVHELAHAFTCELCGGTVSVLEIDAIYGGGLLSRWFPFVEVGSAGAAGRLSGFDTGGSDLVYLATDLGPFLLTLFPGVWALRRAAARGRSFLFGAALPFALAPFLSLTGDAYEIGSILVTQLPPWTGLATRELLRGDDLMARAELLASTLDAPWTGFVLASLLGVLWAFATYALASWIARRLGAEAPGEVAQSTRS